jgi:thiol-disulfide isomerase/thioredoxin
VVPAVLLLMGIGSYFYYSESYEIKVRNGETLDNITARGVNGEIVSLYDIKNKLVLVQFWASWCSPCVREIPELKRVYADYRTKSFKNADGFEIYAFSLDYDSVRWTAAVNGFGLPWQYNVSERMGFKAPTAQRLNVVSIPTNVLIDADHNIIGVDLQPDELEETLERFAK